MMSRSPVIGTGTLDTETNVLTVNITHAAILYPCMTEMEVS